MADFLAQSEQKKTKKEKQIKRLDICQQKMWRNKCREIRKCQRIFVWDRSYIRDFIFVQYRVPHALNEVIENFSTGTKTVDNWHKTFRTPTERREKKFPLM